MKKFISLIFILTLMIIIVALFDHFEQPLEKIMFPLNLRESPKNFDVFYNASLIILTFILACVAWYQLKGLQRTNQAEFLLKIDQRLGDPKIIEAREIIHRYYKISKRVNPRDFEEQHVLSIAKEIDKLSENYDEDDFNATKEHVTLLNFLDFLETVAFFTNNGYIRSNEVDELMGESLIFFYTVFKNKISTRRVKYNNVNYYKQFEILHDKMKRNNHCRLLLKNRGLIRIYDFFNE
jgi:hypothetical protein